MITTAQVAENLADVQERIVHVGGDGALKRIQIIAVTKTHPFDVAEIAAAVGCHGVGENYAQEVVDKFTNGSPLPVHFIGHLQSNKVRQIASIVSVWESIDRSSIADEIAKRATTPTGLVQVNVSGEESKSGCEPGETEALVAHCVNLGIRITGLMTMAPANCSEVQIGSYFAQLRRLADSLHLDDCSMGMSSDFEIAVAEGATILRLGTVLFGRR